MKRLFYIILVFIFTTSSAPNGTNIRNFKMVSENDESPLRDLALNKEKLKLVDIKLSIIEEEQEQILQIVENPKNLRKIKRKLRKEN